MSVTVRAQIMMEKAFSAFSLNDLINFISKNKNDSHYNILVKYAKMELQFRKSDLS